MKKYVKPEIKTNEISAEEKYCALGLSSAPADYTNIPQSEWSDIWGDE